MPEHRTCSVEGCEKKLYARTWCHMHYERWRVYGSLDKPPRKPGPGRNVCIEDGCTEYVKAHGRCGPHHWKATYVPKPKPEPKVCAVDRCPNLVTGGGRGLCPKHYERQRKFGSTAPRAFPRKRKTDDTPSYRLVHTWLVARRGRADQYLCVDCKRPARHWAFDNDPDGALVDPASGRLYSDDLYRYSPRCVACHLAQDRGGLCRRGHELTPDNVYVRPNGQRWCRTCRRERDRNRYSRSRQQ